jgi:protein TonB
VVSVNRGASTSPQPLKRIMDIPSDMNRTQRVTTGIVVIALHAMMGAALLFALAGKNLPLRKDDNAPLIAEVPLPPPPPRQQPRPMPHRRATSAPAAQRAPILAPPPPPLIATPVSTPAPAAQPGGTGEGGGLGGSGTGTGAGGNGNGEGGDGWPPEQIGGHIGDRDYPRAFTAAGISGTVSVHYRVGADGRVTDCSVTRSSGHAELDALTCKLIERRFRFRPARDAQGRAVRSIIVENHSWIIPAAAREGAADGDDDGEPGTAER